jgi:hypothetical protein
LAEIGAASTSPSVLAVKPSVSCVGTGEGFDWIKLSEIGAASTSSSVLAVKLSVSCVGTGGRF